MDDYGTLLVLFLIAGTIAAILHALATFVGPRAPNPIKSKPFESGNITAPLQQRLSIKFYIVALLFILFDMETVFLFPWAVMFRDLGWAGFWSMITFVSILLLGLVYVWKKGALDWD